MDCKVKREIRVRALRDFFDNDHGDWPMIAKGTIQMAKVDEDGLFAAQTNGGDLYGSCRLSNGWEVVAEEEAGKFKIQGAEVDGERLYWSNDDGWVGFISADVFTASEMRDIGFPTEFTGIAWLDRKGKVVKVWESR